jgi:septal ring factor EnvC (AmiA/AmiB activator)
MARLAWIIPVVIACIALLVAAAVSVMAELRSMDASLARVSTRVDALERMDAKLSETNRLLATTNTSLRAMLRASGTANARLASTNAQLASTNAQLASMKSDIAVMSHKISGSFLFRGVR